MTLTSDWRHVQRADTTTSRALAWCTQMLEERGRSVFRLSGRSATGARSAVQASLFDQSVRRALRTVSRNRHVGILVISVDYFDVVVAGNGTTVAHEVLTEVGRRIRAVIRPGDSISRSGDDGFAVLWAPTAGSPGEAEVADIAGRIASAFNEPITTTAGSLPVTVSVGIATADAAARSLVSPRTLRRQARSAVESAQRNGRAQLAVFDRSVQEQAVATYRTERSLHRALRDDRVRVDYQPILSLHSGKAMAVEALARWEDPLLGTVAPMTFIPIAEESGLISELGHRVLQAAAEQTRIWNDRNPERTMTTVNISAHQLLDPALVPHIAELLQQSGLDPHQLCLEISESVVMNDVAASVVILGHLKDLGLKLAIDDFGTGYSSLSYLRRMPVDILKIDQSFVHSVYNRDDRVITKAIIDLAHTLGMTTVAEGVETELQVEVLHALNCDMAQGFHLHAPTAPELVDFRPVDFGSQRSAKIPARGVYVER